MSSTDDLLKDLFHRVLPPLREKDSSHGANFLLPREHLANSFFCRPFREELGKEDFELREGDMIKLFIGALDGMLQSDALKQQLESVVTSLQETPVSTEEEISDLIYPMF